MNPSIDDVEEIEILKQRFKTFEQELNSQSSKVEEVNALARQLLANEHPNSDEVVARQDQLNQKYVYTRPISTLIAHVVDACIQKTHP